MKLKHHPILDLVIEMLKLKNDAALSRELGVTPPHLCKVRNGKQSFSAEMIIAIHERTGLKTQVMKEMLREMKTPA